MFTLADLKRESLRDDVLPQYSFPSSPNIYSEEIALDILKICNFVGVLTDEIKVSIVVKIIEQIETLHQRLLILESK